MKTIINMRRKALYNLKNYEEQKYWSNLDKLSQSRKNRAFDNYHKFICDYANTIFA